MVVLVAATAASLIGREACKDVGGSGRGQGLENGFAGEGQEYGMF